jgi:D-serine deaminase-like pyridoxal phosphate-dependent protein
MDLSQLPTPALVLDRRVLARNIEAMAARMKKHGVDLRPHMKTAKSARVAELATKGQKGGLCVSTILEAEYFAKAGFKDITYAFPAVAAKLDTIDAIARKHGARICLLVDDGETVRDLGQRAQALGSTFDVQIEVNSGQNRGGLTPDSPDLVPLGRVIHGSNGLRLAGVLTHGGHSYDSRSAAECAAAAEQEREAIVKAAATLRSAGLPCPHVSPGSTPTAVHAKRLDGATEMRPGNYMFFDLHQVGIGSCRPDDIAVTVLATVVGHNHSTGRILIDAGGLALSKDAGANDQLPGTDYGWIANVNGNRIADLRVSRVSQEHGQVEGSGYAPFDHLPIGSKVRVMPNHSCMTAAAYGHYDVIDGGIAVVDRWDRCNGWY